MIGKSGVSPTENDFRYVGGNYGSSSLNDDDVYASSKRNSYENANVFHHTRAPNFDDIEAGVQQKEVYKQNAELRNAFIRKVYGLVFILLSITFATAAPFVFSESAARWIRNTPAMWISAMVFLFVFLIALACVPNLDKKVPYNYIIVVGIALCFGVIVGYMASYFGAPVFVIALGSTLLIVIAITIFACQTRFDFTGAGPYLLVVLLVLFLFTFIGIFVRSKIFHIVIAALGVLLFSCFLIYDTQKIVGGKHRKHVFSVDDYIMASVSLYIDIMYIFIFLMEIIGMSR